MRGKCFLIGLVLAGRAWGQDASAGDLATARTLGTEGLRLADLGNCAAAVEKLARAEKLHHAPTTLERLGECEIALGHFVDGTESLRRVSREHIPEGSPPVFFTAQVRAKTALEQALPHLAKVRVDVAGPPAGDVVLKIDNTSVSNATLGVERPIDPGSHVVEATAPGFKASTGHFQVGEGGSQTVTLTLERAPEQPKPQPLVDVHGEGPPPPTVTKRNYLPAGIALGLGGASLVTGGIFGAFAISKKNDLVSACGGTTSCPASQHGAFDTLDTFANVSTLFFVVGAAASVVGFVLVAVAPKYTVVERVSLGVSPTGAWLGGAF
jgi:hypothetical protein